MTQVLLKPDVDLTNGTFYADGGRSGGLPLDAGQPAGVPRPQRTGRGRHLCRP